MKEAALIYLDRNGGLQKFIDDCKHYNGMFSKDGFRNFQKKFYK